MKKLILLSVTVAFLASCNNPAKEKIEYPETKMGEVVDTYFDNGNIVVMFRCQACGGITKNTYELHLGSYISGPRKKVYQEKGKFLYRFH